MIEQLKNKILNYTFDRASEFHGHVDGIRKDSYIWEYTDSGNFLYRNTGAHFFTNDGTVYKLHEEFCEHDWLMFNKFHSLAKKYSKFRTEIPIHHNFVEFNNKKYMYTIVGKPLNKPTTTFFHDLVLKRIDKNYLLKFVEDGTNVIKVYKELHEETNIGLPSNGLSVASRNYDELGVIWIDFKCCYLNYEEFLNKAIVNAKSYLLNVGEMLNIDVTGIDTIAKEEWTKI